MHKITLKVLRNGRLVDATFVVDGAHVAEVFDAGATPKAPSHIPVKPLATYETDLYAKKQGCQACKKKGRA